MHFHNLISQSLIFFFFLFQLFVAAVNNIFFMLHILDQFTYFVAEQVELTHSLAEFIFLFFFLVLCVFKTFGDDSSMGCIILCFTYLDHLLIISDLHHFNSFCLVNLYFDPDVHQIIKKNVSLKATHKDIELISQLIPHILSDKESFALC